ncbi:MAG: hypothetical protein Q4A98_05350 [Comamonadaceae bacterium]|nr:hypothetical protein [Comamonadaceae bacterium]
MKSVGEKPARRGGAGRGVRCGADGQLQGASIYSSAPGLVWWHRLLYLQINEQKIALFWHDFVCLFFTLICNMGGVCQCGERRFFCVVSLGVLSHGNP